MKTRIKTVYEFRPLYEGKMLRYNGGDWIPDDGEYDLAFIRLDSPVWYGVQMPYQSNILWSWCKGMNWRAYVRGHPDGNAWHYMTTDNKPWEGRWDRDKHINELANNSARDKCSEMNRCANGRFAEFNVLNDIVLAGQLREIETKKMIMPPNTFNCCYCGQISWREEEKPTIKLQKS